MTEHMYSGAEVSEIPEDLKLSGAVRRSIRRFNMALEIRNLRERIAKLEAENAELKDQVDASSGLAELVHKYQRELWEGNPNMKEVQATLAEKDAEIERLKALRLSDVDTFSFAAAENADLLAKLEKASKGLKAVEHFVEHYYRVDRDKNSHGEASLEDLRDMMKAFRTALAETEVK